MKNIHDEARGRWRDILLGIGLPASALTGRHGPCVMCGGKDRWRWDDRAGSGSFYCSTCGSGTGVDLVMKYLKLDFREAKKAILAQLPSASVQIQKAGSRSVESIKDYIGTMWANGMRLNGTDPASRYLASRGLALEEWPSQLRYVCDAVYRHEDGAKTRHPAMMAKFVSPDAKDFTLHMTFLDSAGRKADLPTVRKMAPMPIPAGGCVRLCKSEETLGIAEGIETALSAGLLCGLPVWAALSANAVLKWRPPATAKKIVIFADNDASFTGQMASFSLAYRLRGEGYAVEVMTPPDCGSDWNDVLLNKGRAA